MDQQALNSPYVAGSKLPSADPFDREILQWDFNTICDDRKVSLKSLGNICGRGPLRSVPINFQDANEYMDTFFPILLVETKQTINRAKEMEMARSEKVLQVNCVSQGEFVLVSLQRIANNSSVCFSHDDLVLLTLCPSTLTDSNKSIQPVGKMNNAISSNQADNSEFDFPFNTVADITIQLARRTCNEDHNDTICPTASTINENYIFGIVESQFKDNLNVKVLIQNSSIKDQQRIQRMHTIAKALSDQGATWYINRITGLTTMHREYQSLVSLPDVYLIDDILCSNKCINESNKLQLDNNKSATELENDSNAFFLESKKLSETEANQVMKDEKNQLFFMKSIAHLEIPKNLNQTLKNLYNKSQYDALQDCLKAFGVTLIQGPPGTGKTATVIGVLSIILNASVKRQHSNDLKYTTKLERFQSDENFNNSYAQLMIAQPWLYQPKYLPWYDLVECSAEDLEDSSHIFKKRPSKSLILSNAEDVARPKRVLVCAPSNAAVDEILKRLTSDPLNGGGIFDREGKYYNPTVLRVGPNVHPEMVKHSLEYKANMRLKARANSTPSALNEIKADLLRECSIVCSTLSVCGSRDIYTFPEAFDTVVIDEASQGVELSTLIPLRLGCRRLVLVGDSRQLPATVFSKIALKLKYDRSLFQRLEVAGHKVNMLSTQYRMHQEISEFPSNTFYDGQLLDAPNITEIVKPPIPWYSIPIFKPMVFFSVDSQHVYDITSLSNPEEAELVCQLIEILSLIFAELGYTSTSWQSRIGVISPYASQVRLIRKSLKFMLQIPDSKPCPIDVNTVDGFQGREKDFVIFSAVRAKYVANNTPEDKLRVDVGFLADERRLNVALTRARSNIWIVGNGRYLMGNNHWCKLWNYSLSKGFLFNVNFKSYSKELYLQRWLRGYFKSNPDSRMLLGQHVPKFVHFIENVMTRIENKSIAEEIADEDISNNSLQKLLQEAKLYAKDQSEIPKDEDEEVLDSSDETEPNQMANIEGSVE